MEENELRQDHPMNDLIRSLTIVVCLLLQMAGRTFSQTTQRYMSEFDPFDINGYSRELETNTGNYTPLECYKCGAYEHGEDFDSRLKDCRDNMDTADIETCPNIYIGVPTFRYCGITVQTVFGHVTSFSRGCHYLRPCTEIEFCNGANDTGVCQYCCSSSLCNHGNALSLSVPLLLIVALLTWIYHFR